MFRKIFNELSEIRKELQAIRIILLELKNQMNNTESIYTGTRSAVQSAIHDTCVRARLSQR